MFYSETNSRPFAVLQLNLSHSKYEDWEHDFSQILCFFNIYIYWSLQNFCSVGFESAWERWRLAWKGGRGHVYQPTSTCSSRDCRLWNEDARRVGSLSRLSGKSSFSSITYVSMNDIIIVCLSSCRFFEGRIPVWYEFNDHFASPERSIEVASHFQGQARGERRSTDYLLPNSIRVLFVHFREKLFTLSSYSMDCKISKF